MTPDLDQLLHDPRECAKVAPEDARTLLLELAPVMEGLRLAAVASNGHGLKHDRALRISEAAALLQLVPETLRRKVKAPPYDRLLIDTGTRSLRFSEKRVQQFLATR